MMKNYKIVFTGPVGSGKTTAISAISDTNPVATEEHASGVVQRTYKQNTTVALDYGTVHLDKGECIHLYGTPGQRRFDFMWDILTIGSIGLILLLDNTRDDPFEDLRFFLSEFSQFIEKTHVAIGVTRMDLKPSPCLDDYFKYTENLQLGFPIFSVDARRKQDVAVLIKALIYSLDPCLQE